MYIHIKRSLSSKLYKMSSFSEKNWHFTHLLELGSIPGEIYCNIFFFGRLTRCLNFFPFTSSEIISAPMLAFVITWKSIDSCRVLFKKLNTTVTAKLLAKLWINNIFSDLISKDFLLYFHKNYHLVRTLILIKLPYAVRAVDNEVSKAVMWIALPFFHIFICIFSGKMY